MNRQPSIRLAVLAAATLIVAACSDTGAQVAALKSQIGKLSADLEDQKNRVAAIESDGWAQERIKAGLSSVDQAVRDQTDRVDSLAKDIDTIKGEVSSLTQNTADSSSGKAAADELAKRVAVMEEAVRRLRDALPPGARSQASGSSPAVADSPQRRAAPVSPPPVSPIPPFDVVGIDQWGGAPHAVLFVDGKLSPHPVQDVVSGWTVQRIDDAKHTVVLKAPNGSERSFTVGAK